VNPLFLVIDQTRTISSDQISKHREEHCGQTLFLSYLLNRNKNPGKNGEVNRKKIYANYDQYPDTVTLLVSLVKIGRIINEFGNDIALLVHGENPKGNSEPFPGPENKRSSV